MNTINPPMPRRRFLQVMGGAVAGGAAGLAWPSSLGRLLSPADAHAAMSDPFPVGEGLAEHVISIARSHSAEFAELYLERRVVTKLRMADGGIQSVEQGIYAGCGVRAVDRERTGYAHADSFEEEPLLAAARDVATIAGRGLSRGVHGVRFKPEDPPVMVQCILPFDEVEPDERVEWMKRADEVARAYDPAVKQVTIEYTDEMLHFAVLNSEGVWVEDTLPLLYMRVNVNAAKNGGTGSGHERISYRLGAEQMGDDAAGKAARESARVAVTMCEAGEAPSGEMPVILGSAGGVLFHEAVGHGLEGDFVRRGTSAFTGRVGEKVASDRVSVVDTGAIPNLRGSFNVDDEGTVPRKNVLIENGVLRGFMTDRISAETMEIPLSGNGRRQSYRHPPMVRMTNTYLSEGKDDVEEMIRETKSGLYAKKLGGGEVDITSGNFTFGVLEAYRIEDGKITSPVRGANLVGNGPEVVSRIDRVGPDLAFWVGTCGKGQWVPVTSGSPTLRISSMTVGGSSQG